MNVTLWCNRIIRWCFTLLFILVPLILTPVNYELFEYNKMMLTYGLTVVIVAAWLVKMMSQKEIRIARTPLDIPLALFLISQLLSSLFPWIRTYPGSATTRVLTAACGPSYLTSSSITRS